MPDFVGWLIDGDLFDHYREALVSAIERHHGVAKLVDAPAPPYRWDDDGCSYRDMFCKGDCVVAHGNIDLITRVQQDGLWTPGVFCTTENFFFNSYVCHYSQYLLNQDYLMLPFGELSRQREFLFGLFGRDGRVFVRPDSPLKLFTGQLVAADSFDADLELMAFYEFPQSTLVVVSSPKPVTKEWRFVVAAGQVIAGCQYADTKGHRPHPTVDVGAKRFAESIASIAYQPDPVWIADICQTADGAFHLLEIGGFSFSDLYACDMNAVVATVSRAAQVQWRGAHT